MSQLETIFFDWGGVIADDPGDDFLKQLLRNIGANEEQIQEIYDSYMRRFMCGQISEAEYWDELRQKYGFDIHESISEDFKQWRGLIVNEQIVALADQAKAQGLKTAILSNIIEPTYNVLAETGYFDRYDQMIASFQVGYAKPQPEIYRIALERLQATAERSLFIDDKPRNLEAAEQLGFKTILAENPDQIIRDVSAYLNES